MLETHGLTVAFGGVCPLEDVTIVFADRICGLVGPNGAGKTTFFNAVSGFVRPRAGIITCAGEPILALPAHRRARLGLRRTFQQDQVIHSLTAYDNVRLTAEQVGAATDEVDGVLDFVGLQRRHRLGLELSMLERRLVEVAKTLVGAPKVIMLDEPAAGLADDDTARLSELIQTVPERFDVQVILVDHDMNLVSEVCGTTTVLDFGRVIATGTTAEVLADERVKHAYLGTEDVV